MLRKSFSASAGQAEWLDSGDLIKHLADFVVPGSWWNLTGHGDQPDIGVPVESVRIMFTSRPGSKGSKKSL